MNSMEVQYGYEADFVDEIPERLQCIVCHLVMRQPVQIMTCGHRFCKPCYERLQVYSQHLSTPLLCPIDRDPIDVSQVFNDTAVSREIKNLQVKCLNVNQLCPWRGELQNLQAHEQICEYKVQHNQSTTHEQNHDSLKMIEERLTKFEDLITEKDEDIAFLKYDVKALKTDMIEKEKVIYMLKKENADTMNILNESNMELRKLIDNNSALIKNPPPEMFEEVLKPVVNNFYTEETDLLKKENDEMKKELSDIKVEVDILKKSNEELKQLIENNSVLIKNPPPEIIMKASKSFIDEDLIKLRQDINNIFVKLKNIQDDETTASKNDVKELENHIRNLENLSFCNVSSGSREVLIQWKVDNFQHHIDVGKRVNSPIFLTEIHGYAFQLNFEWMNVGNEKYIGIYMFLRRGKNFVGQLKPYNKPYTLEMVSNSGEVLSFKITQEHIDTNRNRNFEILPGENTPGRGYGFSKLLNMNYIKDYMMNNMVTINCRLNTQGKID